MTTQRAAFPVAVHLFLFAAEKILLLRRYNTGYEDGNYSVIAGHVDGGETVFDAMRREAREEAGIRVSGDALRAVQVMHRKTEHDERVDYFFAADSWDGEIVNAEPGKCDDLSWHDVSDLPPNVIGYVRAAIENYRKGERFTLYGWKD